MSSASCTKRTVEDAESCGNIKSGGLLQDEAVGVAQRLANISYQSASLLGQAGAT